MPARRNFYLILVWTEFHFSCCERWLRKFYAKRFHNYWQPTLNLRWKDMMLITMISFHFLPVQLNCWTWQQFKVLRIAWRFGCVSRSRYHHCGQKCHLAIILFPLVYWMMIDLWYSIGKFAHRNIPGKRLLPQRIEPCFRKCIVHNKLVAMCSTYTILAPNFIQCRDRQFLQVEYNSCAFRDGISGRMCPDIFGCTYTPRHIEFLTLHTFFQFNCWCAVFAMHCQVDAGLRPYADRLNQFMRIVHGNYCVRINSVVVAREK